MSPLAIGLLLFGVLALSISWWLLRILRRELEEWEHSLKELDPRDLPGTIAHSTRPTRSP